MTNWRWLLTAMVVSGVLSANVFALLAWRESSRAVQGVSVTEAEPHPVSGNEWFVEDVPDDDFRIGQQDVICVSCKWKHPDTDREQCLTEDFQVGENGKVELNQHGEVYVLGFRLPEAQRAIRKHLTQKIGAALDVSVELVQHNHKTFYVAGAGGVRSFPLMEGMRVADALAIVGGVKADSSHQCYLKRGDQILLVELVGIQEWGVETTNYELRDKDMVCLSKPKNGNGGLTAVVTSTND